MQAWGYVKTSAESRLTSVAEAEDSRLGKASPFGPATRGLAEPAKASAATDGIRRDSRTRVGLPPGPARESGARG